MILYAVLLVWAILLATTPPGSIINNRYTSNWITFSLLAVFTVYLLSDIGRFMSGDTVIYVNEFMRFGSLSFSEAFAISFREPAYTLFVWVTAQLSDSPAFFLGAVWIVCNGLLLIGLRSVFARWQTLLVLLSFLNYSTYYAYLLLGIRQGIAMSILIVAICLMAANKARSHKIFFLSCLAIAPLVHFSALAFSACLAALYFLNPSLRTLLAAWAFLALLFVSGANGIIFKPFGALFPAIDSYTSVESLARFAGVNRLDFLLFGSVWIPLGLFAAKYLTGKKPEYDMLLKVYIIFNAVFVALGFIAFSNRLAAYSWILLPILVWHQVFHVRSRYRTLATVAAAAGFVVLGAISGAIWRVF